MNMSQISKDSTKNQPLKQLRTRLFIG